jgi:N6-L-threonylcarbamoyladenine synthase
MNVLGIESSCDETSVAIISNDKLTANLISSQDFHTKYGGVVPELSSRAHLQIIIPLVKDALEKSNLKLEEIDIICATAGPGLIGALLVGLTFGKSLAFSLNKPFVPVNHIEGHIYSGFLMDEKPEFPYLVLVVSGGHTLLLVVKSDEEIIKLGSTVDDAAGEAFDKVSKMVGLGYPGGPKIQTIAENGNPNKISFPVASLKNPYDFSFSGLKTSVLRYVQKKYGLELNVKSISLVGGVAANKPLRNEFKVLAEKYKKKLVIPDIIFCGDNAAMIAYRGLKLHLAEKNYSLNYNAYPGLSVNYFQSNGK